MFLFIAFAVYIDSHLLTALFALKIQRIEFFPCTIHSLTRHQTVSRTDPLLIEVAHMPILTASPKDMARLIRAKPPDWRRGSLLRLSIYHPLSLIAHPHHQIVACQVFQDSQHFLAVFIAP